MFTFFIAALYHNLNDPRVQTQGYDTLKIRNVMFMPRMFEISYMQFIIFLGNLHVKYTHNSLIIFINFTNDDFR